MMPLQILVLPETLSKHFAEFSKAVVSRHAGTAFNRKPPGSMVTKFRLALAKSGRGDHHGLIDFREELPDQIQDEFKAFLKQVYPDSKSIELRGAFYYPKGGCRGWHTNEDRPGRRVYFTYSDGDSYFRYEDDRGEIVTDHDQLGASAREFIIPELPDQLWHCVVSDCNRISIGFLIR